MIILLIFLYSFKISFGFFSGLNDKIKSFTFDKFGMSFICLNKSFNVLNLDSCESL